MSQEPPGPRTQASRRFWGREWDESVFLHNLVPREWKEERSWERDWVLCRLCPGVLTNMGYIDMCSPKGYGFQAAWSGIGYRNQRVWVDLGITFQETDQVVEDFTVPP